MYIEVVQVAWRHLGLMRLYGEFLYPTRSKCHTLMGQRTLRAMGITRHALQSAKFHHRLIENMVKVIANKNVCLTANCGEILSILGENGSGKTTLMNMISGIYFPDEGQIFIGGEEVTIASPKDAFDHGIGMIHQHFKLVDVLTATENIILGLEGKLDIKAASEKIAADIKAQYNLEPELGSAKEYTAPCAMREMISCLFS